MRLVTMYHAVNSISLQCVQSGIKERDGCPMGAIPQEIIMLLQYNLFMLMFNHFDCASVGLLDDVQARCRNAVDALPVQVVHFGLSVSGRDTAVDACCNTNENPYSGILSLVEKLSEVVGLHIRFRYGVCAVQFQILSEIAVKVAVGHRQKVVVVVGLVVIVYQQVVGRDDGVEIERLSCQRSCIPAVGDHHQVVLQLRQRYHRRSSRCHAW